MELSAMNLVAISQVSNILILSLCVSTDEFWIQLTDGFLAKASFVNKANKSWLVQGTIVRRGNYLSSSG